MIEVGYIKLWRAMLTWEWYDDIPTKVVYIHFLLTANIDDVEWHGATIRRGSLASSYSKIAQATGLTVQQTRTAIDHLVSTGEVTKCSTPKFTVFTLINYDKFQTSTSKLTNNQQTNNTQTAHKATNDQQQHKKNKEYYKNKEYIEPAPVSPNSSDETLERLTQIGDGGKPYYLTHELTDEEFAALTPEQKRAKFQELIS